MPSLGADMDFGTLAEWLVHEGDTVHRGDPMAVIDTEKSAIEVESFDNGVVERLLVAPGTRVRVGTPLASLAPLGAAPEAARPAAREGPARVVPLRPAEDVPEVRVPKPPTVPPRAAPPLRHHAAELGVDLSRLVGTGPHGAVTRIDVDRAASKMRRAERPSTEAGTTPHVAPAPIAAAVARASPYARRLAGELGVDLDTVRGGRDGSIHAEDVVAAAGTPAAAAPAPPEGAVAAASHTSRAAIAALMSRAKRDIPHYYVATTVDLGATVDWLRRTNKERPVSQRLVPAAVLLKATALGAREHPELNGFWVDDGFLPADDVHLGVAVSVRGGALVAPAIHHTADLGVLEVMAALRDLVKRARAGRLRRAEMADPTLTVTDLGDQGVEEVIGVIYPPQVALLGVGRIVNRPLAIEGMIGIRPTVRLTLSGDHRATDGTTGARFLNTLERLLQHPEGL